MVSCFCNGNFCDVFSTITGFLSLIIAALTFYKANQILEKMRFFRRKRLQYTDWRKLEFDVMSAITYLDKHPGLLSHTGRDNYRKSVLKQILGEEKHQGIFNINQILSVIEMCIDFKYTWSKEEEPKKNTNKL